MLLRGDAAATPSPVPSMHLSSGDRLLFPMRPGRTIPGHDRRSRCREQAGVAVPADETTAWDEHEASDAPGDLRSLAFDCGRPLTPRQGTRTSSAVGALRSGTRALASVRRRARERDAASSPVPRRFPWPAGDRVLVLARTGCNGERRRVTCFGPVAYPGAPPVRAPKLGCGQTPVLSLRRDIATASTASPRPPLARRLRPGGEPISDRAR
jgi:hypothetical protein